MNKLTLIAVTALIASTSVHATGRGNNPSGGDANAISGALSGSIAGAGAFAASSIGPVAATGIGGPGTGIASSQGGTAGAQGVGNVDVDASTTIPDIQTLVGIGGAQSPGSTTTAYGRYLEADNFLGLYAKTRMKPDAFSYAIVMLQSTDPAVRVKGKELLMKGADAALEELENSRSWFTSRANNSDRSMRAGN